MLVFVEGVNSRNPEKSPWSKVGTDNKLIPHETASTGIEVVRKMGGERLTIAPIMFHAGKINQFVSVPK